MSLKEKGFEVFRTLCGSGNNAIQDTLSNISPGFSDFLYGDYYGYLIADERLDLKLKEKITVISLAALGWMGGPIKFHAGACLRIGIPAKDIVALLWTVSSAIELPKIQHAFQQLAELFESENVSIDTKETSINENLESQYLENISPKWKSYFLQIMLDREDPSDEEQILFDLTTLLHDKFMTSEFNEKVSQAVSLWSMDEVVAFFEHLSMYYGVPKAIHGLTKLSELVPLKKAS